MKHEKPFESILRPLYEARPVVAWTFAGLWCLVWGFVINFRTMTMLALVLMCLALAALRSLSAYRLLRLKLGLIGRPLAFLDAPKLAATIPKMGDNLWLGWGFRWEPRHTARAYEVQKHDVRDIYPKKWMLRLMGVNRDPAHERGLQWIHGLEPTQNDVMAPFAALKGHCAVIATTGAIKTKLVALIAYQLINRGDTVIVIDPKGDGELRDIIKACADATGDKNKFMMMHPAFASQSVRLDMLKNWDRVSQVASRIAMVLGSQGESTFTEFCWNAVHSITSGMKYIGRRVSIVSLKMAMQSRTSVERLTEEALKKMFRDLAPHLLDVVEEEMNAQLGEGGKGRGRSRTSAVETSSPELNAMVTVFNRFMAEDKAESKRTGNPEKPDEIRGLVAILEANKEWFGKMIVTITPLLAKLSTDDLKGLLSPDYEDINDKRPILDMKRVVEFGHALYVGTDTLADPSVGHAVTAMLTADAAAVAAELYNHGGDKDANGQPRRIHLFIDEWGDGMCEPLIQLANKGRGAGVFIWALGQTLSDLTDALNSEAKALRFMGNMNNLIVGATQDAKTMKLVTEKLGQTAITIRNESQSTGSRSEDTGLEFSTNRSVSLNETTTDLFPPNLLPGLPDLHYVGVINRSHVIKGYIPVLRL